MQKAILQNNANWGWYGSFQGSIGGI